MEQVAPFTPAKITSALAQENVTETVIAKLKLHKNLAISSLDDKEGYDKVVVARKECKNTRTLAEKICKKGRESAIAEQKAWVAKEKEVVSQIKEVETLLEGRETWFEQENEKKKLREDRMKQLPGRKETLTGFGVPIPEDEVLLAYDDIQFNEYVNTERARILDEKERQLKSQQPSPIEVIKASLDAGNIVFATATPGPSSSGNFIVGVDPFQKKGTDKEALHRFAEYIYCVDIPPVQGEEAKKIALAAKKQLFEISRTIIKQAESITT